MPDFRTLNIIRKSVANHRNDSRRQMGLFKTRPVHSESEFQIERQIASSNIKEFFIHKDAFSIIFDYTFSTDR